MSCQNMSRKRAMSASNDNCASSSRQPQYESNLGWAPINDKSAYAHSPARVFIKPKAEASFDDRRRKISLIPLPAHQQRNTRPSLPTSTKSAYALRGRASSLHNSTINFSSNAPPARLRRSSTIVQPMRAKPAVTSSVDNNVRVGVFCQAASVNAPVKTQDKVRRGLSTDNKENAPYESPRTPVSSERSPRKKCGFVRKQSPLVPDEHRLSQRSPTKTFLLPKVEERIPKPQAVLPRRSSARSVAPKLEKRRSQAKKKLDEASIPSLPTIVMEHTPRSSPTRSSEGAVSKEEGKENVMCLSPASYCQTNMTPVMKPNSRLFLLPRQPGTVPSSTSISSLLSLPTQILKHTPLAAQLYRTQHDTSPSRSPCLSKARTKTVWTMLDDMNLVRSGGLLSHAHALAPNSQVRMVPLCKRLRNGVDASDPIHGTTLVKTPVRSSSTPYHLLGSMEQRACTESSSDLPPLPSLSHALARTRAEWAYPAEGVPKKTNDSEKYDWTVVDIKKPRLRSSSRTPIPGAHGLYLREPAKPSLLTRAQTFVKFKFSASKKVVGRGDPKWV